MMKVLKFFAAIFRFMGSIYFILPVVTLILSLIIWFFSPYIGTDAFRPFDAPFGRWVFIAILWTICLLILLCVFLVRYYNTKK
ncbi:MAG: hypothetical protein ABIV25_05905, partial [Paracoccaceae bacterium]